MLDICSLPCLVKSLTLWQELCACSEFLEERSSVEVIEMHKLKVWIL